MTKAKKDFEINRSYTGKDGKLVTDKYSIKKGDDLSLHKVKAEYNDNLMKEGVIDAVKNNETNLKTKEAENDRLRTKEQ